MVINSSSIGHSLTTSFVNMKGSLSPQRVFLMVKPHPRGIQGGWNNVLGDYGFGSFGSVGLRPNGMTSLGRNGSESGVRRCEYRECLWTWKKKKINKQPEVSDTRGEKEINSVRFRASVEL